MTKEIKNIAASVKAKLKAIAESENRQFDFLLMLYMIERLLYRLSISAYSDNFILKGGLLLYVHLEDKARPTKDIDFLARRIPNDIETITAVFRKICVIEYNDGLVYDTKNLVVEKIKEGADYEGIRIKVNCYLEKTKMLLQFDIGFGDVIVPKPVVMDYPVLLNMASPQIQTYSIESVIAEKFEAMIALADLNSRMKDFYDIYSISERFDFEGRVLYEAVFETFDRRGTNLFKEPLVFKEEFSHDENKQKQWQAFTKRILKRELDFKIVTENIRVFLEPIYHAVIHETEYFRKWERLSKRWV
jgi:predicted nucleotidyltransferase component of viral defense system